MTEDNKLNESRIWISGASRGIGAALAKRLSVEGASLVLSATSLKSFDGLEKKLKDKPNVVLLPCDVRSADEVKSAYGEIKKTGRAPDILINCAGIAVFKEFRDMEIEDFDRMVSVNLRGVFLCMKAVLPDMINSKSGMIINILSVAVKKAFTHSSVYAGTKSGLLAMDRSLREEVRRDNIKIIDIIPGATETELWDSQSRESFGSRMIKPDTLAGAIMGIIKSGLAKELMIEEVVIRPQQGDI